MSAKCQLCFKIYVQYLNDRYDFTFSLNAMFTIIQK